MKTLSDSSKNEMCEIKPESILISYIQNADYKYFFTLLPYASAGNWSSNLILNSTFMLNNSWINNFAA